MTTTCKTYTRCCVSTQHHKTCIYWFFSPKMIFPHLKTRFFLVFLFPFRSNSQEYVMSLKKKQNSGFLLSRNCLGTGHRWARLLKTKQESFICGSQKMVFDETASAKRLYRDIKWGNWYHGYGPGQTTTIPAHFVFLG